MNDITQALSKLRAYVERERFKGYDPYDTLNAEVDFSRLGKWGPVLAIQFQKRNPVNIRPLLGIEKGHNPKGMGLLLYAYTLLHEQHPEDEEAKATAKLLFNWLRDNASEGYSGYCWGYNFDWANPAKYLKAYTPSVVVTSFVGRGIFRYYQATGDPDALHVLRSACDFVMRDLPWTETEEDGVCISYTPIVRDCCYNASLLGAELLSSAYAVTGEEKLRDLAAEAVRFVVARQHADGRWNYSLDLESGKERAQVDFHQGFVLDSLYAFMRHTGTANAKLQEALERGARFYRREQFDETGRAKWRLPREWPADIHCQAQGVITFSTLAHLDPGYRPFAERVARWTIEHMQDEEGYFYFRKGRLLTNKIPYMRWAQAWMMVALAEVQQGSTQSERAPHRHISNASTT